MAFDKQNFLEVKQVTAIFVIEGNGVDEAYRAVTYIYDGNTVIGKIDPLYQAKINLE